MSYDDFLPLLEEGGKPPSAIGARLRPEETPEDIGGRVGDKRRLTDEQRLQILKSQVDDQNRDPISTGQLNREIERTQRAIERGKRPIDDEELGQDLLDQFGSKGAIARGSERPIDTSPSGTDEEAGQAILDKLGSNEPPAEQGGIISRAQNFLQQRSRNEALKTQRKHTQSALSIRIRDMKAANADADRVGVPRPHSDAEVDAYERQALPENALRALGDKADLMESVRAVPAIAVATGAKSMADSVRAIWDIDQRIHDLEHPPKEETVVGRRPGALASGRPGQAIQRRPEMGPPDVEGQLRDLRAERARLSYIAKSSEAEAQAQTPKNQGLGGKMITGAAGSAFPTLLGLGVGFATRNPMLGASAMGLPVYGGSVSETNEAGDEARSRKDEIAKLKDVPDKLAYLTRVLSDGDAGKAFRGGANEAMKEIGNISKDLDAGKIDAAEARARTDKVFSAYSGMVDYVARNATVTSAKVVGVLDTIAEVLGERIPLGLALKRGMGAAEQISKVIVAEFGQEFATQFMQSLTEKAVRDPSKTAEEVFEEMLIAGGSGAIFGLGMGSAGAAINYSYNRIDKQDREVFQKFKAGMEQFDKVTKEAAQAADRARAARGPATHDLDGTPVRPRTESGQPVRGVWETDEGDLIEAERAEPVKKPEPNASWKVGGVDYEVEVVGKGEEPNTARLVDGQEVPINEFASLGDEAKAILGLEKQKPAKAEKKPAAPVAVVSKPQETPAAPPEVEVSPPPPASLPADAEGPSAASGEPGAELPNGFRVGPEPDSKYRISRPTGGALLFEKRSPSGQVSSFYVGKDGKLVDAETVVFNKPQTLKRLWIPPNEEISSEARALLDRMGRLALNNPDRAQFSRELADLVKKPRTPLTPEALSKMKRRASERRNVDTDRDTITDAIIKLGGITFDERLDISGDTKMNKRIPFVGFLFARNGESLDGMAEKLAELGYLSEAERGDLTVLAERIKDELGGLQEHWSLNRSDAAMGEEMRRKAETRDPDEDLAGRMDEISDDTPLQGDIPPEELASVELDPDARNIVIADLMSQLDEDTRERLAIQHAESTEEEFIAALRRALKEGSYADEAEDAEIPEGRQGRQPAPPEYRVERPGPAAGEKAATGADKTAVRQATGPEVKRLKAFGSREIDEGAPIAKTWQDVRWEEYLDYYAADINGRRALIMKKINPDQERDLDERMLVRPYIALISGVELRNNGRSETLDGAKEIAFDGHTIQPTIAEGKRGGRQGRGERAKVTDLEQPKAFYRAYRESGQEWVARLRKTHGDKWMEAAEKAIEQVEASIRDRPSPGEDFGKRWMMEDSHAMVTAMRVALYQERQKLKQPKGKYEPKGVRHAEEVRSDQGQVEKPRGVEQKGEDKRGADLQRAEKTRAEAGDRAALFIPLNGEHYDAFERGDKTTEYRKYGGQWTEKHVYPGRAVVLSKGYGKQARLTGTVIEATRGAPPDDPAWKAIYGDSQDAFHIKISVDRGEFDQLGAAERVEAKRRARMAALPPGVGPEEAAAAQRDKDVAILTTPAGTAPSREIKPEDRQPTQQLKLFQRTVDYAAAQAETPESQAQAEAGNYTKGHWVVGPRTARLDVSIETPIGERRQPEWPPLQDHYGYIRGTIGFDKDHLDIFVKPGTRDDFAGTIFVVNQVIGSFDEHKVMLGYADLEEARAAYLRNYEQGWDGLDSIIPMSFDAFSSWATDKGSRGPKGGPLRMAEAAARARVVAGRPGVTQDERDKLSGQGNLFVQTPIPQTPAVLFEKVVVASEKVGTIRLPSASINNKEEAATAFMQLARLPREHFQMIGLDENNNVLAYYNMAAGTVGTTNVYRREVWLALYQTPGVKKVWFAHNHPSGVAQPSQADELLTQQLERGLTRDLGIQYEGHIIIAGKRAYAVGLGSFDIPPVAAQGVEIQVRERMVQYEDYEREALTSPGATRAFLRKLAPKEAGLLFVDSQHRAVAFYNMTLQKMAKLRSTESEPGFAILMRQLGRNNPAAAMVFAPGEDTAEVRRAVMNVGAALSAAEVKVLDAFVGDATGQMVSYAERSLPLNQPIFYSLSGYPSTMTTEDVHAEIQNDELVRALRDSIHVVDNPYQLPQYIVDQLLERRSVSTTNGIFDPTTRRVYLVASNLSPGEARVVLLHELVGHYGMDQIFGDKYIEFMLDLYRSRQGDIMKEANSGDLRQYRFDLRRVEHQIEAAAEWLAHKAERGEEPGIWRRFVAWVRLWLRERGYVKEWSESDILMLLQASRASLLHGADLSINGQPAFHLSAPQPVWRSALMDRVRELGPNKATTDQWRALLSGLLQKGVKPDEIEWSGIREWLDISQGTITKDQVVSFLTEHGVEVKERMLGEVLPIPESELGKLVAEVRDLTVKLDAIGWNVEYDRAGNFLGLQHRQTEILYLSPKPPERSPHVTLPFFAEKPFNILKQRPGSERIVEDGLPGRHVSQAAERLAEITPLLADFDFEGGGEMDNRSDIATRYGSSSYVLPGGREQRELVLYVPSAMPWYGEDDAHYGDLTGRRGVAWLRFNTRYDADGKKVMFIEELQSKRAEAARRKDASGKRIGFATPEDAKQANNLELKIRRLQLSGMTDADLAEYFKPGSIVESYAGFDRVISYNAHPVDASDWLVTVHAVQPKTLTVSEVQEAIARPRGVTSATRDLVNHPDRWEDVPGERTRNHSTDPSDKVVRALKHKFYAMRATIPPMPYVTKTEAWVALAIRRAIRYAVEHGFERVAWTTGAQQNKRYSLSSVADELVVKTDSEGLYLLSPRLHGNAVLGKSHLKASELADWVDDDLAARIIAGERHFTSIDLEFGGKPMVEFYENIVPTVVNNVLKKIGGAKVSTVQIPFSPSGGILRQQAQGFEVDAATLIKPQPGFDITPAIRDVALRGLPMFSIRPADVARIQQELNLLERRVDNAYRRGQKNAEDIDAELAILRDRYIHTLEEVGEDEPAGELEPGDKAFDHVTIEEQFRRAYWEFLSQFGSSNVPANKPQLAERLRGIVEGADTAVQLQAVGKAGSDEQLIEAARDAYAAYLGRLQRRARFSIRDPKGVREVYGVKDGRLLGMASRPFSGGPWEVYLANGTNENMFARGQFRRMQAGDMNEVNRIFNREGLELNIRKPRNIPVPDVSIFDRDWLAPQVDNWFKRALVFFQNRLLLPELYERAIAKEVGPIPESAKAHREARIAHPRAAGKIADFDLEFVEPMIELMRKNKFTTRDVGMYLYARHAPERNTVIEGRNPDNKAGSGMTNERAAQILDGLRERLGTRFAAMQEIGNIANAITRHREQILIDKGLVKMETIALMQQLYPNYVPLKEMVEDEFAQSEVSGGYQIGRILNTAFGRFTEAQAEYILPALVAQAKGTIAAGENAEVLRNLLRLVEYAPNPDVWKIQKHIWKPYIDADTGQIQYAPRPVQMDANYSSRAISVPVNGERHVIVMTDENLSHAFKTSGLPVAQFSRLIANLTRFYALMATAANPEFIMTNLMRDFQQAIIRISGEQNPGLAAKVAKDMPAALWGAFSGLRARGQYKPGKTLIAAEKWHGWYRRYIEAGGHVAYRGMQDVETQHKDFVLSLAEVGIYPEVAPEVLFSEGLGKGRLRAHRAAKVMGAKWFTKLIIDANGAVENALRLSAFKNAIEAGWNEKDAAMLARNVTVDFNLKGEAGSAIGAYYMFFNANIQGTALLFRSVMNHRAIQFLVVMLFIAGMGFDWWNRHSSARERDGRKVYDNISSHIKERNFVLMDSSGEAAITVPLPFGFNIFYVAGVHAMSVIDGAAKPLDAASATLVAAVNSFNPFGQSPSSTLGALQLLSPTFFDPIVQAWTNRNWFDRSIVPERPKTAAPQAKSATYYAGTPPWYMDVTRWLNEATGGNEVRSSALDIAPNMLEHWVRSIFGGAGGFYARVAEYVHAKSTDAEVEARNTPFLRRLYYEPKDYELSHRFYENINASEVAHFEVLRAMQAGDRAKAQAYAGEFQGERMMYGEAMAAERLVGQLRQETWRIRKNERLLEDQRKKQIDQLEDRIRQTMMQFNVRFEQRAEK